MSRAEISRMLDKLGDTIGEEGLTDATLITSAVMLNAQATLQLADEAARIAIAIERPGLSTNELVSRAIDELEIKRVDRRCIDVVFDGPPGPECGRFIEVEDEAGHSINAGAWIDRGNGMWALRIEVAS